MIKDSCLKSIKGSRLNSLELTRKGFNTLLDLLIEKGIMVHAACGGHGRCGKCRVKLKGRINAPTQLEKKLIPQHMIKQGYRLACQYVIKGSRLEFTRKGFIKGLRLKSLKDSSLEFFSLELTRKDFIRRCGLALDLGTTVIKGARVDLGRCEVLSFAKIYNPQNFDGADVMTRISAALSGRYDILRRRLLNGVSAVTKELGFAADASVPIPTAVAGNPVMSSFYLGKPVAGLARYPYAGAITKNIRRNKPPVFIFGSIGGFVGGDTIAGILASGLHKRSGASFYIDLGTNGEIALLAKRRIHALSAAAGPAFEGAGLECGSLAIPGAIDAITDAGHRCFRVHTIGNKKAHGICASGLIDLLAVLLRRGWLTRHGRLTRTVKVSGISVGQGDIRQLQLAIGAIHTGLEFLMEHAGVGASDITDAVITGEFGSHLRIASLYQIGIIPTGLRAVRLERDLPLKGAVSALCDDRVHKDAEIIRGRSRHIELAMQPDFQQRFVKALQLAPWNR
ncbi:MAG TPA: ASKHA domain-containing protein [bacterium]